MSGPRQEFWCVEVFSDDLHRWVEWATWLDQATAYAERDFALEQGYTAARVRRQPIEVSA